MPLFIPSNRFPKLLLPLGRSACALRLVFWVGAAIILHVAIKLGLKRPIEPVWDLIVIALSTAPLFAIALNQTQCREQALEQMTRIASTDDLTGLMNRRAFFNAVKTSDEGALLVIDIDHFKAVNDRYGHGAGDAVLISMADHLRRNIRGSDLLGRIGGEEFAMYLIGADSLQIDRIGGRICNGFVLYNDQVPAPIKVTMSIGAAYSAMSKDQTELFKNADDALYAAKRSGRARLNFWQPATSGRS